MKPLPILVLGMAASLSACAAVPAGTGAAPTTAPAAPALAPASAVSNPMVGGAPMAADRTIAANASAAPDLSTLMSAVRTAGLANMLAGPGPFTVFAPTNEAFGRLAPGTVETLLQPGNRETLTKVLTYHVVRGTITAAELRQRVQAGGGTAHLATVAGDLLTARVEDGTVTLTDMNGTRAYVETPDVRQSNGIVHVINGVLVPRLG